MTNTAPAMRFIDAAAALPDEALLLPNTDDVLARFADAPLPAVLALQFPKWTDGRAYSQAVLLRSRLRHAGALIATGDVVADMLPQLQRCGFTAVQLRADQRVEVAERALGFFPAHYQADRAAAEPT